MASNTVGYYPKSWHLRADSLIFVQARTSVCKTDASNTNHQTLRYR